MRSTTITLRLLAALSALGLLLAACGGADAGGGDDPGEETTTGAAADTPTGTEAAGEPIRVGVVTSTSGPLSSYGDQYVEGFEAGLAYATDGSNAVDGRPIEVTFRDDTGDPAQATSIATELIGEGYTILAGTVVSGVALQMAPLAEQNDVLYVSGPAATDGVTGINRNTFRSGRQTGQDVLTSAQFLEDVEGQTVTVFAQDTAFGQANVEAVDAVLGARGAQVDSILVPGDTTDFAPFAVQAAEAAPDLLFVAWAGETAAAMWSSLNQQGVFDATTVVTGLAERATYETSFGDAAGEIGFLAHYFAAAADNEVNQFLADEVGTPDIFHPDGFVGAQMIVRALRQAGGPDDVDAMIDALEGWTFQAPKGEQTVRAQDHAMLQPMFQAELVEQDGAVVPQLIDTADPEAVAPEPVEMGAG